MASLEEETFNSYEDYLDSLVQPVDLFYLEDPELARQVIELGYKGKDVLSREEFEARKRAAAEGPVKKKKSSDVLCSAGKDLDDSVFLQALAEREELVRSGKLSTIIFIRDYNKKGHEVSGYIDLGQRFKTEDFEEYFGRKKKLLPKRSDLSFYNWKTRILAHNHSSTFQVISDDETGLLFKHKRDRKIINVDPRAPTPGDNSRRTNVKTDEYLQVVIYDHVTRRKN